MVRTSHASIRRAPPKEAIMSDISQTKTSSLWGKSSSILPRTVTSRLLSAGFYSFDLPSPASFPLSTEVVQ